MRDKIVGGKGRNRTRMSNPANPASIPYSCRYMYPRARCNIFDV